MRSGSDPSDRARALLAVMNTSEKIAMLHGYDSPEYTGLTVGNKRLGIPALQMNDGRQGFRPNDGNNKQTAFPCELANVATFDKVLMRQFGEAMGEEFAGKGGNVMLAPMLILARVPQGGRNFESTGEDPELCVFPRAPRHPPKERNAPLTPQPGNHPHSGRTRSPLR